MTKKHFFIVAAVVSIAIAVGWWLLAADTTKSPATSNTPTPSAQASDQLPQSPTDGKLYVGDRNAKTILVEYADYKCPRCGDFHQKAGKEIRSKYIDTGKAKIEFRPFPLFGEDAGLALYGSYCANEQKLFTQYHDAVFEYMWQKYYKQGNYAAENEKTLTPDVLSGIATSVNIEKTAFETCLSGKTYKTIYEQTVKLAAGDSVQGTPTFVVGDEKIVGPQPFNIFKVLLDLETSR